MSSTIHRATLIRDAEPHGFVHCNAHFREATGLDAATLASRHLLDWLDPTQRGAVREALDRGAGTLLVVHRGASDATIALELRITREGERTVVLARAAGDQLDAIAPTGVVDAAVPDTLHTIARIVEEQNPGYRCSILLVRDGHFVKGAGPSLPADYNTAIDGYAVGPTVGSCGTAIYWNVPVIVEDIANDPLWAPFAALAAEAGVGACWSHPFTSSNDRVLGAIALYAPEPRAPTEEQLLRLRTAARMTGLAVERGQAERELELQRARERELEAQLRQAAKFEALGVLAGGVAHDFNNVLYTIITNAEHALSQAAPGSEVGACLEDIIDASQRASGFCRQMLDYAGRGTFAPALLDLTALVPQVRTLASGALDDRTRLLLDLPPGPLHVEGDESQLLSLLLNLVTNAAQAAKPGGGRIVISAGSRHCDQGTLAELAPAAALVPGDYCLLTVEDDGCGMDADTASRIFDPFFTTRSTGRGLGLAAAQGIIARHSGAIHLRTEPGAGSTFTLLLPLSRQRPQRAEPDPGPPATPATGRLLLAEDNDDLRRALARQLRSHGFDVVEAPDGQKALQLFESEPGSFDLALLDYAMPERDGAQVCAALHTARPELPVVVMTGNAVELVRTRMEGACVASVLQKPVNTRELLKALALARGS